MMYPVCINNLPHASIWTLPPFSLLRSDAKCSVKGILELGKDWRVNSACLDVGAAESDILPGMLVCFPPRPRRAGIGYMGICFVRHVRIP